MSALGDAGGVVGVWGANIHLAKDRILTRFLCWDARAWSFLGRIVTEEILCVKTLALSKEGVKLAHFVTDSHGICT